jgi:hypothetical protein
VGKKLDDGVARNDANVKGTLSIIEGKVYEKVRWLIQYLISKLK